MYDEMKKILFDDKSSDPISLQNENAQELKFLQVYATVFENEVYCILSPTVLVGDSDNRSALVFKLLPNGNLRCETNAKISAEIFNEYYSDLNARRDKA